MKQFLILILFISGNAMSNSYEVGALNLKFESPEGWPKGVEHVVNRIYMAAFAVNAGERRDEYARAVYLFANKAKHDFKEVVFSKRNEIENGEGSKMILALDSASPEEGSFFIWFYFDRVSQANYISAERMLEKAGVLLRVVAAWPLLNNCNVNRLNDWVAEMDKLFSSISIEGLDVAENTTLSMGADLQSDEVKALMSTFCSG